MRHNRCEKRFDRRSEHLTAMLNNMAASLLTHKRLETTLPKAKELRKVVEKLVTLGKKGDIQARRRAFVYLKDRSLVKKLFDEIAPLYSERDGGYTRILRVGNRRGDAAPLSIIELVEEAPIKSKMDVKERKKKVAKGAKSKKEKETIEKEDKIGGVENIEKGEKPREEEG